MVTTMEIKQDTIQDILETEKLLAEQAEKIHGEYATHAADFGSLLGYFAASVDPDRLMFAAWLAHLKKHYYLAFFSAVRLHHTQTTMDLRQVLEAGSWAAYAIANPEVEKFYLENSDGTMDIPEKLGKARNRWLAENYPDGSNPIKQLKNGINDSSAHASIVYALKAFTVDFKRGKFEMPYFDFKNEWHIKTDLWHMANIAMGLLDLFYGINRDYGNVIKIAPHFLPTMKTLKEKNDELKKQQLALRPQGVRL